jgi:hypothetical protein
VKTAKYDESQIETIATQMMAALVSAHQASEDSEELSQDQYQFVQLAAQSCFCIWLEKSSDRLRRGQPRVVGQSLIDLGQNHDC